MKRNYILSIFIFLLAWQFYAQELKTDSLGKQIQTIVNYDDYFTTRLGLSNKFNSFKIKDRSSNLEFLVTPNQEINASFSLAYRFLEVSFGFTPRFLHLKHQTGEQEKSKFFNLGTRFYLGQFLQNIQYSRTKGFYIDDLDPEFSDLEVSTFYDLKVVRYGGSTSYILNPNFSMRTIFKQNEWQTKSSGSFVPTLSYYWTRISGDDAAADIFFDITLGPSYFYNWIIKENFLVAAGVGGGMGYNQTKFIYEDDTPTEKINGIIYTTQFNLALGYNSTRFFTGANMSIESFYHNSEPDFRLDDHQHYFEFYVGYRFNAPRKVTQGTDYIEKQIDKVKKEIIPNK